MPYFIILNSKLRLQKSWLFIDTVRKSTISIWLLLLW